MLNMSSFTPICEFFRPASLALLMSLGFGSFGLSACSDNNEDTLAVIDTAEQTQPATPNPDGNTETDADATTDEASTADESGVVEGTPVRYDIASWQTETGGGIGIDDLDAMQSVFGKVTTTDENSLDYASNTAVKYRFMEGDAPYLDIIDSQEYLEFGWYFANPGDSDAEKDTSISHAKKVYTVAGELMGKDGQKLVENMLNDQIIKNEQVGGQQVELAKCEFYSCMLILKKSS